MEKMSIVCKGQRWDQGNENRNEPRVLTVPSIFIPKAVLFNPECTSESHGETFSRMLISKPYLKIMISLIYAGDQAYAARVRIHCLKGYRKITWENSLTAQQRNSK